MIELRVTGETKRTASCACGGVEIQAIGPPNATAVCYCDDCNSVMLLTFDDAKHWANVYRSRLQGEAPPLQMRICTKFKPAHADLPDDVPRHAGYPFTFLVKLLVARVAMLLHR